jgi:hypothetical protein
MPPQHRKSTVRHQDLICKSWWQSPEAFSSCKHQGKEMKGVFFWGMYLVCFSFRLRAVRSINLPSSSSI